MNDKLLEDIRWFGKRFSGIIEALPYLEKVVSLESHLKELIAAKAKAAAEHLNIQAEITRAKAIVEDTKTTATVIVESAKLTAKEIIAKAKDTSATVLQDGKDNAAAVLSDAVAQQTAIGAEVNRKKAESAKLDADIVAKTAEHVSIQEDIYKLRSKWR